MIRMQRRTDCQAFIARRGLNISPAERRLTKNLSVGHAVQCTPACHRQVFTRHARMKLIQYVKNNLFKPLLHRISQVHVALRDLCVRLARRAKPFLHAVREMPRQTHRSVRQHLHPLVRPQRLEVTKIQLEARAHRLHQSAHLLQIRWLAIRRKPHHFAFIAIFRIPDEFADHRIETAERVWQVDAIEHVNLIALAARHHG